MTLNRLPDLDADLGDVKYWVSNHLALITVQTVLATPTPRADILQILLQRVRYRNSRARSFRLARTPNAPTLETTEQNLRRDVRDNPAKFNFHPDALRSYHPVHIAELICLLLDLLRAQGIDSRVQNPGPKAVLN